MKKTLLVLALTAFAAQAHAATWTLGNTSTSGLRIGIVTLTDTVDNLGTAGDSLFGSIGNDINETTADSVTVGSWDATTASLGGNSIDLGVSHEAKVSIAENVAIAYLMTNVSLDNATIADADLTLDYSALAPARLSQTFIIAPELGESMGDLVNVSFDSFADHTLEGNLNADSLTFDQDFHSSYDLYLNGSVIDASSFAALGHVDGAWNFQAHIGDVIKLEMRSQSQFAGSALGLPAGGSPYLLGESEAFASMTVTTVPEPETWAMLVMGLGLVSLRLRNKSKSSARNQIGA